MYKRAAKKDSEKEETLKGLRTERDHALVGLTEQGGIWISCRLKGRKKPRA